MYNLHANKISDGNPMQGWMAERVTQHEEEKEGTI